MNRTRLLRACWAALLPVAFVALGNGCGNKDKVETATAASAAPSQAPTPAPTPTPTVALQPEEDAGADAAADAATDAGVKVGAGGGAGPTGIKKCCAALAQNVNSAPPEQKMFYQSAAGICNGLVNSPQGRAALSQVRAALMGAKAPAACQ
jgi:hypothetical protein